jgi:hypothetical protein
VISAELNNKMQNFCIDDGSHGAAAKAGIINHYRVVP